MTAGICSYAMCGALATHEDMGWEFCASHFAAHRADFYGDPWEKVPGEVVIPRCGTQAAVGRHQRRKEKLCVECRASEVIRVRKYRESKKVAA